MSLRKKTICIIALTLLLLVVGEKYLLSALLLDGFEQVEQQAVKQNVQLAQAAIKQHIDALTVKARDWAAWDDTYRFVEDLNPAYIESNLNNETLASLGVNFILFFNQRGELVRQKAIDLESEEDSSLPETVRSQLLSHYRIVRHDKGNSVYAGFLPTPSTRVIVASLPIITSKREGPIRGTLIFGKYFKDSAIAKVAELSHQRLTLSAFSELPVVTQKLVRDLHSIHEVATLRLSSSRIAGLGIIPDINENPFLILQSEMPREIHEQGLLTLQSALWFVIFAAGVFGLITVTLLEHSVLSKVSALMARVRHITDTGDLTLRITHKGSDELSELSRVINQMLESLRLTQEALRLSRDAADSANRAKSEFLANMSHEIRTPLNGIIGMTSLLKDTQISMEQGAWLETIHTSAESLLDIINDILDFSKIEAGKVIIEQVPFNPIEIAESVASLIAPRAQEKGINLLMRIAPTVPRSIAGDPSRLRQILLNLLGNAVKFTHHGTVRLDIAPMRKADSSIEISFVVRDTGVGIPGDKLELIFDEFSQADSSVSRRFGGTGLGLAITHRLVGLMHGSVVVESDIGAGSTFTVSLPFALRPELPDTEVQKLTPEPKTALVVMAAGDEREIFVELLNQEGILPSCVENLSAAIRYYTNDPSTPATFSWVMIDEALYHEQPTDFETLMAASQAQQAPLFALLIQLASYRHSEHYRDAGFRHLLTKPILRSQLAVLLHNRTTLLSTSSPPSQLERDSAGRETSRTRVLLAEDNPVNQTVAQNMLEKLGCAVQIARNGQDALQLLKSNEFDIVLMDCQMPVLDGYLTTQAIRADETGDQHVPVVAMTANAMQGDRERCLLAGMDDYLPKPIRKQDLETILKRWTSTKVSDMPCRKA